MTDSQEVRFQGVAISEGIAMGTPHFLKSADWQVPAAAIAVNEVDQEIGRYRTALFSSRDDLRQIQTRLVCEGSDEAATIFDTHMQMLEDPLLTIEMEKRIREKLQNPAFALKSVLSDYGERFSHALDVQEKWTDVMDVAKRVLGHLHPQSASGESSVPSQAVCFAERLSPSDVAGSGAGICAFVTQTGGGNSHAALMAREKEIPYVSCIDLKAVEMLGAAFVIVDGFLGEIILDPTEETQASYVEKKERGMAADIQLEGQVSYRAETMDGAKIQIFANVGSLSDMAALHLLGVDGVGLFRTEYLLFEERDLLFSEERQYALYEELVRAMRGLPVVIRVFDVGGDKYPELTQEKGLRGIRFLLQNREVFRAQVRAILRAAEFGDVRILLPWITDTQELEMARALIDECAVSLGVKGVAVGSMIEVPSAVVVCDAIAKGSDFLSVGTNDLIQYTLGVDRDDSRMSEVRYPAHPAVLRMIKMIVIEAKRQGKNVSICGEMASHPLLVPLLLGLGVDQFSCSPPYFLRVKQAIRSTTLLQAFGLAEKALAMGSAEEVSRLLNN